MNHPITVPVKGVHKAINAILESVILVILCVLPGIFYFTDRRRSIYDVLAIAALLLWSFTSRSRPWRKLPPSLLVVAGLYFLSYLAGAILSQHKNQSFPELNNFWFLLYAGLLYSAPLRAEQRRIIVFFFFLSASLSGLIGIMEFAGIWQWDNSMAPHALSPHPILYSAMLALACGSAIIIFFMREDGLFQSNLSRLFLLVTICLTFGGIISSQSRGTWLALMTACGFTLFLYDRRKSLYFALIVFLVSAMIIASSGTLRHRAGTIVTSLYTENEQGSTGNRFELWKGSLYIFQKHPVLGTGIWDFESDITDLIGQSKIKSMPYTMHAHSLYFQALATRGITGLALTVLLLASVLRWGIRETRHRKDPGGYVIIFCAVLTIVGSFTEVTLELSKYLAVSCYTIGLFGPPWVLQITDAEPVSTT
jgi:O-antigen ligase